MLRRIKYERITNQFSQIVMGSFFNEFYDAVYYEYKPKHYLVILLKFSNWIDINLRNIYENKLDYGAPSEFIISELCNKFNTNNYKVCVDGKEYKKE